MKIQVLFLLTVLVLTACSKIDNPMEKVTPTSGSTPTSTPTPSKVATTITLNLDGKVYINDKLFFLAGDAAINIATITSGAPVTITSSDESVVSIDGSGNIVPVGPGTATITIAVKENLAFTAATETVTIVVGRKVSLAAETGTEFVAQNGDQITGTAPNTMHLSIPDGALVRLKYATIKPTTGTATAAIVCAGDATLILEGTNYATGMYGKASIQAGPEGTTLTIDGTGSIRASVLNKFSVAEIYTGAAIGSSYQEHCGNIEIKNGTITAYATPTNDLHYSLGGAGIGSGMEGSCQNITISGGNVTARGGFGCAIGCGFKGNCNDILINGGVVDAESIQKNELSGSTAAIGAASNSVCGNITITDGTVHAISVMNAGNYYSSGAGIGTTFGNSTCGNIIISGGTVIAQCSKNGTKDPSDANSCGGPGIGAGGSPNAGSGNSTCGKIIITGGNITATGGLYSAGIGIGKTRAIRQSICGDIIITGGIINACGDDVEGVDDIGVGYYKTNYTIGTITVDVTWNGIKGYTPTTTGYNKVP